MAKKYYAVKRGRKTGIFESWAEACKQVKGFSGAHYQGFNSREEAMKFLEERETVVFLAPPIYAVAIGLVPGVYYSWDEAKIQIDGFSGAKYRKCRTQEEAEAFIAKYKVPVSDLAAEARIAEENWRKKNCIPFNRSVRHKHRHIK
ncbi:MAG: RNase H1/viroplasmin domain-containing protein [Anaerovibrio sp.]|uniref:RNase H1/viroplasmin domain-containing protein n=1 Tax=Anaerovibrio sp. TaxID=1872532 RepID=UPI0025E49DC8|nr:RNase H1/viroplasmin domain-containing protein [Anaerovibrio sp.]MCR5175474.1 RNase H1/viroplasmin domain-containing protein [Anaerovibrio sp.]